MQRVAGSMLIIGSILFASAAFTPISGQIFGAAATPTEIISFIEADPTGWLVTNILFGAGSLIAAIGVALFTVHLHNGRYSQNVKMIGYVSAGTALVAALMWLIISYLRVVQPEQIMSINGGAYLWLGWVYVIGNIVTLLMMGAIMFMSDYSKWLGGVLLVFGVVTIISELRSVPLVYYIPFLIAGIVLLVRSRTSNLSPQPT